MIVAVPRETTAGERRVALVPEAVKKLVAAGLELRVEAGAGLTSGVADAEYEAAGAELVGDAQALWSGADVLVSVQPPTVEQVGRLRSGGVIVSVLQPFAQSDAVQALAKQGVSSLALDLMPRTTLAQSMDVLSSMSTLAGYKAVLIAASALPKLFPMMMTAAGTLRPARVLVVGAGVAGLQAIATARRLGAVVEAFDIRAAVKEQVESLGARFVEDETPAADAEAEGGYAREQTEEERERAQQLLARHCAEADVLITTALVPGRRAPLLITEEMVAGMSSGAVVVDLAAEQGGNCAGTVAGEVVDVGGVSIHGPVNLPASVSVHASQMFARNVMNYLLHLTTEGKVELDLEDELVSGPLVTHGGDVVHAGVREALEGS